VLAVVRRDDRVLLVQRANPPNQGLWGFPGGLQDVGETLAEAALRELREETGVAARIVGPLTALDALQHDTSQRVEYHFTLVAILLDWLSGEGAAADDAADTRWVTLTALELPTLPLIRNVADVGRLALAHTVPKQQRTFGAVEVASDEWVSDGANILNPELLEKFRKVLEDEAPIILEHWFYRGSRSPAWLVFDSYEKLHEYLMVNGRPGDLFCAWHFGDVCRDDNRLGRGKFPNAAGQTPRGGPY
jgi:ADP-ribose pyrophosphatase YjhB (NUDIX family)